MSMAKEGSEVTLKPGEKWSIIKNVVVVGIAFMVQYTAYHGASNLQSSINAESGLGTESLAAVYIGLIFSSIFLPAAVIKWLGTKWAISLSFVTYMPYIAAQLYPRFYTLIPAGLLVGLGGGPLWCAKCTYISVISEEYSKISKVSPKAQLVRFLGVFFTITQLNQVWGNLISSLVLSSGHNKAALTTVNASMIPEICGANFLPSADYRKALPHQPPEKIQMLVGIFLTCMVGATLIVAIGVDSTKRYTSGRSTDTGLSGLALLSVTVKLISDPHQLLMVPVTVFIGLQQAFFGADFTAAFVSCAVGTGSVGFVVMAHGIADVVGCAATGYLSKVTGRVPLIGCAAIINSALFTTMLMWRPHAHKGYVLYVISVLWGLCNSLWLVQINAYYGILFPGRNEAAFSNFRLWDSLGYIIAYVISPYLRTSAKTYVLFITMIIGVVGYFVVEFRQHKSKIFEINNNECIVNGCDNAAGQDITCF